MKTIRPAYLIKAIESEKTKLPENLVCICSTRNNCRITVFRENRLEGLASVRRSRKYPGYERRLGVAAYTFARDFARRFLRKRIRRKSRYVLYIKGSNKQAVLGLLDGGMRFLWALYTLRRPFNGCVASKARRTGRRKKKRKRTFPLAQVLSERKKLEYRAISAQKRLKMERRIEISARGTRKKILKKSQSVKTTKR